MALTWACGATAPGFEETEIAGLIAHDPAVRSDLMAMFTGGSGVEVRRNDRPLTPTQARGLAFMTGVCRRPSRWFTRESLAVNLQWIFTCRSLPFAPERVRTILAAIGMSAWKNSPALSERIESMAPVTVQALALACLCLLPHRVLVIESPLAGWSTGERSLLLDTLYVCCETDALKLIVAARRYDLPPFCDRLVTVERGADGLIFAEVM